MNLKIISAGAGSGKTYSLTHEMTSLLMPKADGSPADVRASGILATTFTNKAAAELKERVRVKLLEEGLTQEADELGNAMIGTVHAIGVQLLKRFAFEAGVSPDVDIIADSDQKIIFNQSLSTILTPDVVQEMELLSNKLGFKKDNNNPKDWRDDLRTITDKARSNNLGYDLLEASKAFSIKSFFELLPEVSPKSNEAFYARLRFLLEQTIMDVDNTDDGTKSKQDLLNNLRLIKKELDFFGELNWYEWLNISKKCDAAPKKCREAVAELSEFALTHDTHPQFHADIKQYISRVFELSMSALQEYEQYKNSRGLIDYTDMEVALLNLLENEQVLEVLGEELDLLLVDEFQDTNPIQLKIFLKLSELAKQSIWVGDPKQSIYGFRGAAPELMKAVMNSTKNIEALKHSWRSRQDLVNMANGLFSRAFDDMPLEHVALEVASPFKKEKESDKLDKALQHWVIDFAEGNKIPGKPWLEKALARCTADLLKQDIWVRQKGSNEIRPLQAGDIAILCRTNKNCQEIASHLHSEGIKASISRTGLLETAEACLIQACLKFILHEQDSLSVAEILLLMDQRPIEDIIDHRLHYLSEKKKKETPSYEIWGSDVPIIKELSNLRRQVQEMSATEILNLIIEKLDVRRLAVAWGNAQQRLDNIDALRSLALQYEENCNRLHNAATLGGFLLWLGDLAAQGLDEQGSGSSSNAVNILTYHKSKGLEWPLVICADLNQSLKENVFDLRVVALSDEVDLKDPLANRLLCFWVNPYANLSKNTALLDAIDANPIRIQLKKAALEEEARTLYVGLTRARDYLILPVIPKSRGGNQHIEWINRVFHKGDETLPSIDVFSKTCLWTWKGEDIEVKTMEFSFDKDFVYNAVEAEAGTYLKAYAGEKTHLSVVPESPRELFEGLKVSVVDTTHYHRALSMPDGLKEEELNAFAKVLHLFIRSDQANYSTEQRRKMADELLRHFALENYFQSSLLVELSKKYYAQLKQILGDFHQQTVVPFQYQQSAQFFKGVLDYCLQIPQQKSYILIRDVNIASEEYNKRKPKASDEAYFLFAAQKALESKFDNGASFRHFVHFPAECKLVELQLDL